MNATSAKIRLREHIAGALRGGTMTVLLAVVSFSNSAPLMTESFAESSPEATVEVAVECLRRTHVNDPNEHKAPSCAAADIGSGATSAYSPTRNLSTLSTKGHCLPNGHSAPFRC